MEKYYFVTHWFFLSPIERVWEEITDLKSWPLWWNEFKKTTIRGDETILQSGSYVDCEVRGGLPYTLRFSLDVASFQPPNLIHFIVLGELKGDYRWVFEPHLSGTGVTAYWDCGTPKPIMNFSAKLPFVKSILERNHEDLMSNGYRALKSRLNG